MLIRLYSSESKPHKIIPSKYKEDLICGEIKSTKCIKRKTFFSFDYDKELEKTLADNDYSFFFSFWIDSYPTSAISERIHVGKTYWTIINDVQTEWKITDKNKLNEFRNYILENYEEE